MTHRIVRLSGLAFVLVVVASLLAGGSTPDSGASASELASFYDGGWRQGISAMLLAATVPFLVLFAASIVSFLAAARGADAGLWGYLLVGGSVLAGAGIALAATVHFALADGGDQIAPTALQALNSLDGNTWLAFNTGFGVMMIGAAGCLWRQTGFQLVLGRIALVLGVLLFLPFVDFLALLVTLLWIVVTSVVLYQADRATSTSVAVPAT
jgi:hypothetical protein